jgi:hypothetical protein
LLGWLTGLREILMFTAYYKEYYRDSDGGTQRGRQKRRSKELHQVHHPAQERLNLLLFNHLKAL